MTDNYEAQLAHDFRDIERRIRRARKLARQFGLRLTQRQDRRGGDDFWMLGPPRTFEDIEAELLAREERERKPAVTPVVDYSSWEEWANRPVHPIDPPKDPT